MKQMILAAVITLAGGFAFAQSEENLGQHCPSFERKAFKACLAKESEKIYEGNIPNEVIYSTTPLSRQSALTLLSNERLVTRAKLQNKIKKSVAIVVIIQYNDEPQMYYYSVSADGQLEFLTDMNLVDMPYYFPHLGHDRAIFYLKAKMASEVIKDWVSDLSFDEN